MFCECLQPARFYLPKAGIDLSRWACIACDQYTSEPSYWAEVEHLVGDAPSCFRLILPECNLKDTDARVPLIQETMRRYLAEGILCPTEEGYILTARTTQSGTRLGLMVAVDLECYDYHKGSTAPIRASEETVEARIPPRMKIRRGAALELPHVLLLMNDPNESILEPFYARRQALPQLYDAPLLPDGGHISGWGLFGKEEKQAVRAALDTLPVNDGLLFAVGDGNHSLATAKACWEELKPSLSQAERKNHPARYALVELVNIHSKALVFAPIHRVLFGADQDELMKDWQNWCHIKAYDSKRSDGIVLVEGPVGSRLLYIPEGLSEVEVLQAFLDDWLCGHPEVSIDYIHGDQTVKRIAAERGGVAFLLPTPDRDKLFGAVAKGGSLPRKTFSMGHANEKRYYLECRKLVY